MYSLACFFHLKENQGEHLVFLLCPYSLCFCFQTSPTERPLHTEHSAHLWAMCPSESRLREGLSFSVVRAGKGPAGPPPSPALCVPVPLSACLFLLFLTSCLLPSVFLGVEFSQMSLGLSPCRRNRAPSKIPKA